MLPTVSITAAFPVPTPSNPNAVFVKEQLVEIASSTGGDETRQLRHELALARADLRAKVSEDFRRKQDFEASKRKWRAAEAARAKEEKGKELEVLGLPESCGYLLDTAQFAMRQYQENEAAAGTKLSESQDKDAASYDRAVKRIMSDTSGTGAQRLQNDLQARAEKNAKRARITKDGGDGVNLSNARFLKNVDKVTSKDARAQSIKQNLERGTAL